MTGAAGTGAASAADGSLAVTGDTERAVAVLEEVLKSRTRVLGADHPDTAATRRDLARRR